MKKFLSVLLCLLLLIGTLTVNVCAEGGDAGSSDSLIMWALMGVGVLLIAIAVVIFITVVLRKKGK